MGIDDAREVRAPSMAHVVHAPADVVPIELRRFNVWDGVPKQLTERRANVLLNPVLTRDGWLSELDHIAHTRPTALLSFKPIYEI